MTSTTLKYKSNFAPAFSKTFKRRLIDMIAMLASALFIPIFSLCVIFYDYIIRDYHGKVDMTNESLVMIYAIAVICGLFALSIAPKMFSEIYKKQSCDLYFSAPIKREEYFCANFLYGIAVITAGFLLTGLIFNIAVPLMSNKNAVFTINWSAYIKTAVPIFLAILSLFSIFMLCAVTAGKRIHYILLCAISIICTSTLTGGFVAMLNSIWGLSVNSVIPSAFNPVENAVCCAINDFRYTVILSVISVIETVAVFIFGLLVFKRRKAEVAEVTLTGKIVPYVFLAIFAGAAFMYGNFINGTIITIIAGSVLAVLMTMAFSGIFYKKVFTKQTGITAVCVCVICSLFAGCVYAPSYSSFVKKLPEASQVESVELYDLSYNSEFSGFISVINNNSIFNFDVGSDIKITSEQGIEKAIALHQKMIDDKTIAESPHFNNVSVLNYIFDGSYDSYGSTYDCKIVYNLKSGEKITRTYSALTKYLISEFADLMKEEETLRQIPPFSISKDQILFADYEQYDYNAEYDSFDSLSTVSGTLNADEYGRLVDAYKADLLNLNAKDFIDDLNYPFYIDYYDAKDTELGPEISITVYYLSDDIPDEIREKVLAMSPAEINNLFNNYYYYEYEENEIQEYNAIQAEMIRISPYHTQANKYFNSITEQ